jgi:hypothetical protein
MAKTSRDRVKQLRERRKKSGGRTLSCWLERYTARKLDLIKEITGHTNDKIIKDALEQFYERVIFDTVAELRLQIQEKQKQKAQKPDLLLLYGNLIKNLQYQYIKLEDIKKALNSLGVPDLGGHSGNWKVDQIRQLMK